MTSKNNNEKIILTTSNGAPVEDNLNSLTAGPYGPILIQDFHLIDKLAHFDRQRIPERVVHAKGAGPTATMKSLMISLSIAKPSYLKRSASRLIYSSTFLQSEEKRVQRILRETLEDSQSNSTPRKETGKWSAIIPLFSSLETLRSSLTSFTLRRGTLRTT